MSRPLALTLGEPAGIGPDITLAAWAQRAALDLPAFYVLADPQCLARRAERLGLDVPLEMVAPENALATFARALQAAGEADDSLLGAAILAHAAFIPGWAQSKRNARPSAGTRKRHYARSPTPRNSLPPLRIATRRNGSPGSPQHGSVPSKATHN